MSPDSETTGPKPAEPVPPRSLAEAIGARRLMIAIVAMPFVFLLAAMAAIAILGPPKSRADRVGTPPVQTPQGFAPLVLPEGARIAAMALDGDRLVLRIEDGEGGEIVVYDLARGAPVATIPVTAEGEP